MTLPTLRIVFALSCLAAAATSFAGTATYTGSTTLTSPTYNRPLAATPPTPPSGLSGVGTAVHYTTQTLTVDLTGSYTFLNTATIPALWDNFSVLYATAFNPLMPLLNAVAANDDNPSIGLTGFTISLTAGTSYIFLTTGFANTDVGAFTNVINGPGNITLAGSTAAVPEAAPGLAILLAVVAGVLIVQRRLQVARI